VLPTRRTLLGIFLGVFGLSGQWLGVERAVAASARRDRPPHSLAHDEIEDLVAFTEILVKGHPLSVVERDLVVDHVRQRQSDHDVAVYRTTVSALQRIGGARFSRLRREQRSALTRRYRLASSWAATGEDMSALRDDIRIVRTVAAPDLIRGYYRSSAGWAVVGYSTFPGRCGDLRRYTRPER
jgi:hypothetical protein